MRYVPLFVLLVVSAIAGLALDYGDRLLEFGDFMHYFMGISLLIFACLKLFDVAGFKRGFCKYDLLAGKFSVYGYIYPFLELFLACGYLSFFVPILVYFCTLVLFAFGAVGVIRALWAGVDVNCSCMGSVLSVPLSVITLGEDIFMVIMALLLLQERLF